MPWTEIVIAICSIFTIVASILWVMIREFTSIRADLRSLDSRVSRIEGYIAGRDSYRTGTDK